MTEKKPPSTVPDVPAVAPDPQMGIPAVAHHRPDADDDANDRAEDRAVDGADLVEDSLWDPGAERRDPLADELTGMLAEYGWQPGKAPVLPALNQDSIHSKVSNASLVSDSDDSVYLGVSKQRLTSKPLNHGVLAGGTRAGGVGRGASAWGPALGAVACLVVFVVGNPGGWTNGVGVGVGVDVDDLETMATNGLLPPLAPGARLVVDEERTLELGPHGVAVLSPGAVVTMVASSEHGQEVRLERGALHAIVDAPPRFFAVATSTTRAVDMGCEYDVEVVDGATWVRVQQGAVSLEHDRETILLPAGAMARADGKRPPLPLAVTASAAMRAMAASMHVADDVDLEALLAVSTDADAITVWHLLMRTSPALRLRWQRGLATLVPPPTGADLQVPLDVETLFAWYELVAARLPPPPPPTSSSP